MLSNIKNGKIKIFYSDLGLRSEDGITPPGYTIYQIIEMLKNENADIFNDVWINYGSSIIYDADSVFYDGYSWRATIIHYDEHSYDSKHIRYFDSETGELLREWWE